MPDSHAHTRLEVGTGGSEGTPPALRRWLARACPDQHPPATVTLNMAGRIRVKAWLSFTASQWIDSEHGFVWSARARKGPLVIEGSDRFADGSGAMTWKLWGRMPLVDLASDDVSRSAAWRYLAESLIWLPGAGHHVKWRAGADDDEMVAVRQFGRERVSVSLRVDADGRLTSISGPRWGNPNGLPFGHYSFGVDVLDEMTVDGLTFPSAIRAAWGWGTSWQARGEFFHARITSACFG